MSGGMAVSPERLPVAPEDKERPVLVRKDGVAYYVETEDKMPYANLIADQILRLEERVAAIEERVQEDYDVMSYPAQENIKELMERVATLEMRIDNMGEHNVDITERVAKLELKWKCFASMAEAAGVDLDTPARD